MLYCCCCCCWWWWWCMNLWAVIGWGDVYVMRITLPSVLHDPNVTLVNFRLMLKTVCLVLLTFYVSDFTACTFATDFCNLACSEISLIIRPHHMHSNDAAYCYTCCGIVCRSVCWKRFWFLQKTAESLEVQFDMWTLVGPSDHVLDGSLEVWISMEEGTAMERRQTWSS